MAGYTAVARIERADVHVAPAIRAPGLSAQAGDEAVTEELAGRSLGAELGELAERIREQWAITTFYLFDPESWR